MPSTRSYRNGVRIAAEQTRHAPTRKQVWLAEKLCAELSLPYPRGLSRTELGSEIALLRQWRDFMRDHPTAAGASDRAPSKRPVGQ